MKYLKLLILSAFTIQSVQAQEHFYDFFSFGNSFSSDQSTYYSNGNYMLLEGKSPQYGRELWVSDGTPQGTRLLKDCSADENARFRDFVSVGRYTFFNIYSTTGRELWYTDGTEQGTVRYKQSPYNYETRISYFKGWVFYTHITDNTHYEVRRVDTAFNLDTLVTTFTRPISNSKSDFVVSDSFIYFNYDVSIYRMDSLMDTVKLFWQKSSIPGGDIIGFSGYKNALCWSMRNSATSKTELYGSNEVIGKTKKLAESYGYNPLYTKGLGNKVFMLISTDLFVMDISSLSSLTLTSGSSGPVSMDIRGSQMAAYNGKMYFQGRSSSGFKTELWASDGSISGTKAISTIATDTIGILYNFRIANNKLFFNAFTRAAGRELWCSAGSASNTVLVKNIVPAEGSSIRNNFLPAVSYKNKLFFAAYTDSFGCEPWVSDGSANGTRLFADLNNTFNYGNQEVSSFMPAGDYLFLTANDSLNGLELWRTDGTVKNTILVQNISESVLPTPFSAYTEYRHKLFATAFSLTQGDELYTSNGQTGKTNSFYVTTGSLLNSSSPHDYAVLEPYLFYTGRDNLFGADNLFRSDGTGAGTGILNKGVSNSYNTVSQLRKIGNLLYFSAQFPGKGVEPAVSDGSLAGTKLLKDISPSGSSSPVYFCGNDTAAFFAAWDENSNMSLYRSDGTETGTVPLFKFSDKSFQNLAPDTMLYTDGTVILKLRYTGSSYPNTAMLCAWDIQADSLRILQADTGELYTNPSSLTVLGKRVVYSASGAQSSYEPWITDGTEAGTYRLKDIMPGSTGSAPAGFTVYNGLVVFSAKDAANGREPWVSDGSREGTRLLWDIEPGSGSSNPSAFAGYKGYIYIAADQGPREQSLFRIEADSCNAGALSLKNSNTFNSMCKGLQASLYVESRYGHNMVEWYRNDTLLPFINDTFRTEIPGVYRAAVSHGACYNVSEPLEIRIASKPSARLVYTADSAFCEGSTLQLKQTDPDLKSGWYRNGILVQSSGNTYTTSVAGNFYTISANGFGCIDTSNILSPARNPKPLPVISRGHDTLFCSIDADSFQWKLNNVAVPNATAKFLRPLSYGNYTVEAFSAEGCKGVSPVFNYSNASVQDLHAASLKLYPNPVTDRLILDINDIHSVTISDLTGKLCLSANGNIQTLNVSALEDGVYLLQVRTKAGSASAKFIKTH